MQKGPGKHATTLFPLLFASLCAGLGTERVIFLVAEPIRI